MKLDQIWGGFLGGFTPKKLAGIFVGIYLYAKLNVTKLKPGSGCLSCHPARHGSGRLLCHPVDQAYSAALGTQMGSEIKRTFVD